MEKKQSRPQAAYFARVSYCWQQLMVRAGRSGGWAQGRDEKQEVGDERKEVSVIVERGRGGSSQSSITGIQRLASCC